MSDAGRILQYLPEFYERIRDFAELDKTESAELDELSEAVRRLLDDQFVVTAGVDALKRRERMLGIQADPSVESIAFRRNRIINRYSTKPPFTMRYLQEQLDRLVGPGRTVAEVDVQNLLLTITTTIENAALFREVEHTVKLMIPANLVYQQHTALNDGVVLAESIVAQEITWNYKLDGSWQLGAAPFATLGPEVPVK